jgi:hypothetical protein
MNETLEKLVNKTERVCEKANNGLMLVSSSLAGATMTMGTYLPNSSYGEPLYGISVAAILLGGGYLLARTLDFMLDSNAHRIKYSYKR